MSHNIRSSASDDVSPPRRPGSSALAQVAVCLAPYPDYQLGILQGVRSYLSSHAGAFDLLTLGGSPYLRPGDLPEARPEGVIANIRDDNLAVFESLKVPVVKIGTRGPMSRFPTVEMDGEQAGRVALSHLASLGLRNLACVGLTGAAWSDARLEGFRASARACHLPVADYELRGDEEVEIADRDALAAWLRGLGLPCGVFASTDMLARRVIEVARGAGLAVPRDLAVLGFNNGLYECLFAEPHLSSVPQDRHRLGFEAARLLHGQISTPPGSRAPIARLQLRAAPAVRRRTTATLVWADPVIQESLDFFYHQLSDSSGLAAVFEAYPDQRVRLTRRLDPAQGGAQDKTEAARLRLVLAEQFTRESAMPFTAVAEFSGFWEVPRMRLAFADAFGCVPQDYRVRFGRAE